MIVTVNSQALAGELRLLNKVVPSKPVIPILSHVLLTANGQRLALYATDLEVGLRCSCDGTVQQEGVAAVPSAKLLAMVEQFPDGDVTIALDKNQVNVRCGGFKSRLQAMRAEDFPPMQEVEGERCSIDAGVLAWLFDKARHATSSSTTRHVLNGALLKLTGEVAAIVATDGKRLVVATAGRSGPDLQVVVPSKTMDLLSPLLGSGVVELASGARHIFFDADGRLLTSRTIDGAFPAYERIVPRGNDKVVQAERSTLSSALKRVILAAEENGAVHMSLSNGLLNMASASAGIGAAEEAIAASYEGEPLKICINGNYVLDFLAVCSEPTVTILLKDATSAALLQDGRECFSVIMLMR